MVLDNGRGTGDYGNIQRVAMLSVHTSPIATLGGKDAGGMNVYVRDLSRQLGRRGIAVDIFTRRTDPHTPTVVPIDENVRLIYITAGPTAPIDKVAMFGHLGEFASEMALFALRDGVSYDVIHGHYWLSGWVALLLRRYWDAPTVQMFHTLAALKVDAARGAADGQEPQLRVDTERQIIEQVDTIIAANARERAEMIWWYGRTSNNIATVPCGIDLDLFRPQDRAAARAALGLGAEPTMLYVGRIDPVKGIDFLLDGFARLHDRWEGALPPRLLLVGGTMSDGELGPDLAGLRDAAAARGGAEQITFCGPQPHDALPTYYAATDLTVVPSRYESFGLVAVESMACGTPVVASRAGGLAYTIEDQQNGFLVPYGDADILAAALNRALGDAALRERLRRGALATAAQYSWERITDRILDIYRTDRPACLIDAGSDARLAVGD
jgi:D-inositol-3-phosphate glycosyltransferase